MTALSDDEIMELAGSWFYTGENQKRDDGYYYRSLGTPSNVRGSDLIEFARALLQRSQPVAVVPAEQAEDSAMLDWLEKHFTVVRGVFVNDKHEVVPLNIDCGEDTMKDNTGKVRAAIRAAIGRNREAGGS